MKVVFTVLDALPFRHVGDEHTPVLADAGAVRWAVRPAGPAR